MMKRMLGLVFAAMMTLPLAAEAADGPGAAQRVLKGRWGFGLDTIPGASANPIGGFVSAPNAVAVRWWATEKLCLDLMGALDASTLQTSGSGVLGGGSAPGTSASGSGFGLGVKYGLTRPSRDMHTQAVARVSTATSTQKDATGLVTLNSSTTGIFIGAGFEAFVPGWHWLTLEGSAGLALTSQTLKPESGSGGGFVAGVSQSTSSVSLGGAGFTPINLSIHVYF